MTISVLIATHIPSPYQVELFNALAASRKINLTVLYTIGNHPHRLWRLPDIRHDCAVVGELSWPAQRDLILSPDLSVFAGYNFRGIRSLIRVRDDCGRPWALWGERPGFILPSWIGGLYRVVFFPELRRKQASIWGIGSWAIDGYRREFGIDRHTVNVPYFSDLDRFFAIDRTVATTPARKFIFSGSLIKRKGVDLLMSAFVTLAHELPDVELHVLGSGPLEDRMRADAASVADRVHFHGFRQWEELQKFYSQADILCAPSRYDGWGLIVPEALAAGLLVVTTDKTGAAVDLIDSSIGWVVSADSKEALVIAMRQAANVSPNERSCRIARGRSSARRQNIDIGVTCVLDAIDASLHYWNKMDNHANSP